MVSEGTSCKDNLNVGCFSTLSTLLCSLKALVAKVFLMLLLLYSTRRITLWKTDFCRLSLEIPTYMSNAYEIVSDINWHHLSPPN